MTRLEDLQSTAAVRGILPEQVVTVVSVQWFGSEALELTYKGPSGRVPTSCSIAMTNRASRSWSTDARAVHTSLVEPLPHQITAVYEVMLPRQPLRFLLADDPGAGKTIMAGLLIKELIVRGDCSVVSSSAPEVWPSSGKTSFTAASNFPSAGGLAGFGVHTRNGTLLAAE
jgi:hypothetical protein